MKIAFISNYLNHHQYPFCKALIDKNEIDFVFIATMPVRKERLALGYHDMNNESFVIRAYESQNLEKLAEQICYEFDVVITGSAPEKYAKIRLRSNKLLFRYSERLFKKGNIYALSPKGIINIWKNHGRYYNKNVYMLCAGAYVASDFNRMGSYYKKTYKWGYFPEIEVENSVNDICSLKQENSILWVGRFIDWKHPEIPILIAKKLKQNKFRFNMKMIGLGDLSNEINNKIKEWNLEDCVEMLGAMPPERVRQYMKKSEIFIFTSDFNEGWGAVLNEAMNSCCAVIASHAIGSVPFLIEHEKNGIIYKNGDIEDLYEKTVSLLSDCTKRKLFQKNAYETIVSEWNAGIAADRFILLSQEIIDKKGCDLFTSGPCSRAVRLSNNWFKR